MTRADKPRAKANTRKRPPRGGAAQPAGSQGAQPAGSQQVGSEYAGPWLDLQTAAQQLGVSVNTLRRRLKAGELPGARLIPSDKGPRWVLPEATVREQAERRQRSGLGAPAQTEALQARVRELEQQLRDRDTAADLERVRVAQIATDLRHQAELQTVRADSLEQIALERLRTLTALQAALELAQSQVRELENPARRRWWQRSRQQSTATD